MSNTLPCFDDEQRNRVHELLAIRVAHMMGRKLEEGDWSYVYCRAKGIPEAGWSNLNIDVMHENVGIEHKMLCYRSNTDLTQACGTTLMHPSATRSIRVPSLDTDPDEAMVDILGQYRELIASRAACVQTQSGANHDADMRTGWLLWQESLRQFLYFEEPMVVPEDSTLYAQWVERNNGAGARKGSKNLWVYDRATGRKRYSITTSAGAKIQPYFDVPPPDDPNLYLFTVMGERILPGRVRVWLTKTTARELEKAVGGMDVDRVSDLILGASEGIAVRPDLADLAGEAGTAVVIREDAYQALVSAVPGVSDEHCVALLLETLRT